MKALGLDVKFTFLSKFSATLILEFLFVTFVLPGSTTNVLYVDELTVWNEHHSLF